ncbi:MAG TPA: succinate dehydrogenase assembly factor 2 [Candidatus Pelagibacter bacterium]|jgi:antitoxin CptB|nr:succinate dehydrogenase assembly factor 2 [Candidatus Pelagibacter bacterium]|tara:strand:+ start:571 stop:828 length:258 start_codon:yes stop_codon:yes gene_type:complete
MNSNKQNLINKIKYRSQYRGTKEMDIFVNSFVNKIINDLDFDELEHLSKLINLNDEEIVEISDGKVKTDINKKIFNLLIDFKKKY